MKKTQNLEAAEQRRTETTRKSYASPRIVTYGFVKDIVKGNHGELSDQGQATFSRQCWIAEAVYGVEAPQTMLVRAWLPEASRQAYRWWLFCALYRLVGRQIAALIRNGYMPSSLFRPGFDGLLARANAAFSQRLKA
jgi:hypothetical protein